MDAAYTEKVEFNRLQNFALIIGVVALVVAFGAGAVYGFQVAFRSYLLGYIFWLGIAVGCLGLLMLQHLVGGRWGLLVRPILEAGTRTLLPMAVLFIPIILGAHEIYVWTNHEVVAANEALEHAVPHKAAYLNVPFFAIRAGIYFLVWLGLAYFLNKWARQQNERADARLSDRFRSLSGIGMVVFIFAVTFASFDWIMSLEPEWYSSIFGLLILIGWTLSALSFVITALVILAQREPLSRVVGPAHFHDLGKLLLTFVMVWAYFSFSQLLIIWSGNLPEEIPWYLRRMRGGWGVIGVAIILLHFALPFVLLLSRSLKRRGRTLVIVACMLFVMRLIDLFWMVVPTFHYDDFRHYPAAANVLFFVAAIGMGGLWLFFFAWQLKKRPLIPFNDPKLEEAIAHGHGGHH